MYVRCECSCSLVFIIYAVKEQEHHHIKCCVRTLVLLGVARVQFATEFLSQGLYSDVLFMVFAFFFKC